MKIFERVTWITLALTLGMITLGGVVHNTGSSLACPDWPLCFGQVFPKMEGEVAIEHSHRLLGSLIGLFCIALLILGTRVRRQDPKLFKFSLLALVLVILQGVLGGVTVLMRLSPLVSSAHLALSQIFMATLVYLALRARRHSQAVAGSTLGESNVPAKIRRGLLIALVALFVQMLLGAAIRHGGAGVACGLGHGAMLLCQDGSGGWWPEFGPAQLHMIHRYFALVSTGILIAFTVPFLKWVKRNAPTQKCLRLLVVAVHALVTTQVFLGMLTIATFIGVIPVTLHLVTAVLLCFVLLCLNFLAAGRITT